MNKDSSESVTPLKNVDRIESGVPFNQDPRIDIQKFFVKFDLYNPNTGNSGSLNMRVDSRTQGASGVELKFDPEAKEFIATILAEVKGGWPDEMRDTGASVLFNSIKPNAQRGSGATEMRAALAKSEDGSKIPIRFEDRDGNMLLKSDLVTSSTQPHNRQKILTFALAPQTTETES